MPHGPNTRMKQSFPRLLVIDKAPGPFGSGHFPKKASMTFAGPLFPDLPEPSKQNRSSAVMQQRKAGTKETLDDFPTPPWATRAVIEKVIQPRYWNLRSMTAWEPCCNRGYMAEPLREYFGSVYATDIKYYGYKTQDAILNFLDVKPDVFFMNADWVFMNPPFVLAEDFIKKGLEVTRGGVAAIVRSAFLEGSGRYERLFKDTPPTIVAQHVERVPMVQGAYDPKAASATAYSWLIWVKGAPREPQVWIPPCKSELYREGDEVGKFEVAA